MWELNNIFVSIIKMDFFLNFFSCFKWINWKFYCCVLVSQFVWFSARFAIAIKKKSFKIVWKSVFEGCPRKIGTFDTLLVQNFGPFAPEPNPLFQITLNKSSYGWKTNVFKEFERKVTNFHPLIHFPDFYKVLFPWKPSEIKEFP